ncbi:FHA domain-containing protein [Nocardioides piscis]|uniref:FHA domain-containing protein n=1 Tax=Nocardioides piscis TaxID=2714938 RepID=A0A6G7YFA4_9ACTN|nr:FHA domain-containing protein [Nocardioides piscis]QIK75356.1 FHA domain-containing protein [Nocardioides piscis]
MSDHAVRRRTFAPGDSYAVVGDRVTALIAAEGRDRVAALWDLVERGQDFETVLDVLVAGGLSNLPAFALVGHGDRVRVLVRGDVTVTVVGADGPIEVVHEPGTMWSERSVEGVTGGRIVAGSSTEPELVVIDGIVRASVMHFGDRETPVEGGQALSTSDQEPPVADGRESPVVEGPAPDLAPTPEVPAQAEDDHDGQTTVGSPVDGLDRPRLGTPGQQQAPAVVAHPVAKLIFSTGEVLDVDRVILVGRAPEAHRFASSDLPRLVTVASPSHEISSTHLEIRPGAGADHGMAVVTDMGSTNGTVLVQPGLPPEDLQAGIAVSLIPGAILDLGDGVTIQTTNP